MKKKIFAMLLAIAALLAFVSCTETVTITIKPVTGYTLYEDGGQPFQMVSIAVPIDSDSVVLLDELDGCKVGADYASSVYISTATVDLHVSNEEESSTITWTGYALKDSMTLYLAPKK